MNKAIHDVKYKCAKHKEQVKRTVNFKLQDFLLVFVLKLLQNIMINVAVIIRTCTT